MRRKIVVIGAGLAGSLLCNELADRADVALLEIGRKDSIAYPDITFDRKKLAEVATCCHGGGGTTNLWHNGLIPLRQADLTDEVFSAVMAEAESYADRAASALFFSNGSYRETYARLVREITEAAGPIGELADGLDCLIYPKRFSRLKVDARVQAVYSVAEIGFVVEKGRVTNVSYTENGRLRSVRPDTVIVAAGALGTPRVVRSLLQAADARVNGLGTGFIDHPMGFVGKIRASRKTARMIRRLSLLDRGEYVSRNGVRLKSDCGRYTCCIFFRPAVTMDNRLSIYKYKSLLGASRGMARLRNALSGKVFHPDIVAEIVSHLFGVTIPGRTFNILFMAEQKPGNNRVYDDGDTLRVDWSISAEELSVYRNLLKKLETMLGTIADDVNMVTDITEDWLWSAAHHSCTVSLGDGADDLVDRDLKLKCLENAFVCDGSIIQEHSYANTGLAIGQLALRLAGRVLHAPAA